MSIEKALNYMWRVRLRRLQRAATRWGIERIDSADIGTDPAELRMFMLVRNEQLRLPFLLDYYFQRGVDRVFVIDNNSTDDTLDVLLAHQRVHVFRTSAPYALEAMFRDWLLLQYGLSHWCILVDADELLTYPRECRLTLRHLCELFDEHGATALECILLDCYPDSPLSDTPEYKPGMNPLDIAPYFDRSSHRRIPWPQKRSKYFNGFGPREYIPPSHHFVGGVRNRIFGVCPNITKFPLVRFAPDLFVTRGVHAVYNAVVPPIIGAVLHFKFIHDFASRVEYEASRGAHWNQASQYKAYNATMKANPALTLFDKVSSVRYAGSEQLVSLGIMRTAGFLDRAANAAERAASNHSAEASPRQ